MRSIFSRAEQNKRGNVPPAIAGNMLPPLGVPLQKEAITMTSEGTGPGQGRPSGTEGAGEREAENRRYTGARKHTPTGDKKKLSEKDERPTPKPPHEAGSGKPGK